MKKFAPFYNDTELNDWLSINCNVCKTKCDIVICNDMPENLVNFIGIVQKCGKTCKLKPICNYKDKNFKVNKSDVNEIDKNQLELF